MVVLDQPHQIEAFKLLQVIGRLKIEVSTGMSSRQPTLKIAKRYYHLPVSKKTQALELLEKARDEILKDPTQIWLILARLRRSRFFFHCGHCGWQGDEFTVGKAYKAWYCPNCNMDESGLEIARIICPTT